MRRKIGVFQIVGVLGCLSLAATLGACTGDEPEEEEDEEVYDTVGVMAMASAYTVLALPEGEDRRFQFGFSHAVWSNNVPIAGDFDGDGKDTVGTYEQRDGRFLLGERNAAGRVDLRVDFRSDRADGWPVAGDWDGDGIDTIGIYDGTEFLLRNENVEGEPDLTIPIDSANPCYLGSGNWACLPLAGDWDGNGRDEVALWWLDSRPTVARLYDLDGEEVGSISVGGFPMRFFLGAGDWDGDGVDSLGRYDNTEHVFEVLDADGEPVGTVDIGNEAFQWWWPIAGVWDTEGDAGETTGWDWETGDPEDHGFDPESLDAVYASVAESSSLHSLLVVRHGVLVAEEYFNGFDATMANNVQSASKSIESALFGIASKRGELDVTDPVADYFPQYFGDAGDPKRGILLEHLLTMSAGLDCADDGGYAPEGWIPSDDWIGWPLQQELIHEPGTVFGYATSLTHLGAAVLEAATGKSPSEYAFEHLYEPLGIGPTRWDHDPTGLDMGGAHVHLRPRDMARFGQLYVEGGTIDGKQILDPEWISWSTSPLIHTNSESWDYGGWWWIGLMVDSPYAQALGYGGQAINIVPELDLVVVVTQAADVNDAANQAQIAAGDALFLEVLGTLEH